MAPAKTAPVKQAGNKLATIQPSAVAVKEEVPEHLRRGNAPAAGFEEADKEDFVLPRLSICQDLTPQRKASKPNFIEGLKEGDFFNTVTGQIYGKKITVVPLFLTKQRIKFGSKIGDPIQCSSPNGKTQGQLHPESCRTCPHSQWGTGKDEQGQACTEFKNIVLMIAGGGKEPIVFSNKSSAIKVAKQWLSMMKMSNLDMFASYYELTTETATSGANEYFSYSFKRTGYVPAEVYASCKSFYESLHDKTIAFNPDDFDADDTADAANPDGAF